MSIPFQPSSGIRQLLRRKRSTAPFGACAHRDTTQFFAAELAPDWCYFCAMDDLSDGELNALQNLAEKKAGNSVAFINIAAARRLTDLGLALRSHEGWDITPKGSAALARRSPPPA